MGPRINEHCFSLEQFQQYLISGENIQLKADHQLCIEGTAGFQLDQIPPHTPNYSNRILSHLVHPYAQTVALISDFSIVLTVDRLTPTLVLTAKNDIKIQITRGTIETSLSQLILGIKLSKCDNFELQSNQPLVLLNNTSEDIKLFEKEDFYRNFSNLFCRTTVDGHGLVFDFKRGTSANWKTVNKKKSLQLIFNQAVNFFQTVTLDAILNEVVKNGFTFLKDKLVYISINSYRERLLLAHKPSRTIRTYAFWTYAFWNLLLVPFKKQCDLGLSLKPLMYTHWHSSNVFAISFSDDTRITAIDTPIYLTPSLLNQLPFLPDGQFTCRQLAWNLSPEECTDISSNMDSKKKYAIKQVLKKLLNTHRNNIDIEVTDFQFSIKRDLIVITAPQIKIYWESPFDISIFRKDFISDIFNRTENETIGAILESDWRCFKHILFQINCFFISTCTSFEDLQNLKLLYQQIKTEDEGEEGTQETVVVPEDKAHLVNIICEDTKILDAYATIITNPDYNDSLEKILFLSPKNLDKVDLNTVPSQIQEFIKPLLLLSSHGLQNNIFITLMMPRVLTSLREKRFNLTADRMQYLNAFLAAEAEEISINAAASSANRGPASAAVADDDVPPPLEDVPANPVPDE